MSFEHDTRTETHDMHMSEASARLYAYLATCPPIVWMRMNADAADAISGQAGIPGYLLFDALNDLMCEDVFFESECEREHIKKSIPIRNAWFGDGAPVTQHAAHAVFHPPHNENHYG